MTNSSDTDRLDRVRKQIKEFPTGPGVYFLKGPDDVVLYIGKAKSLRSRVASYFQPGSDLATSRGPRIVEMAEKVVTADYLETETEVDAMLKEARLIKDVRPPYNTNQTDDKTFPYLEITTREDFPGVYITRQPRAKGTRLFGPFANVKDLRAVLVELQKIFRFRTCNLEIAEDDPKRRFFRPCLLHSIKQCTAPCAARIDKASLVRPRSGRQMVVHVVVVHLFFGRRIEPALRAPETIEAAPLKMLDNRDLGLLWLLHCGWLIVLGLRRR